MASVIINRSRGNQYVQVIEDYYDDRGNRRRKVIQSFGPASPVTIAQARQFAGQYNVLKDLAKQYEGTEDWDEIVKQATMVLGLLVGAAAIAGILAALFGKKD